MNSSGKSNIEKTQKSRDKFENIKTDYFLIKLFNNFQKKTTLNIINYIKSIQKRLNINDYEEYLMKYSSIEIEIKPIYNKYGKFIIFNEKNEKYFHIYFDNIKQEIKRNYTKENEQITLIKIIIDYQINSFKELFNSCDCIESIIFKRFYRNNKTDMSYMSNVKIFLNSFTMNFQNYQNLKKIYYIKQKIGNITEIN